MKMNPPTLPADYVHMVAYDELVTTLELIRHATAPSHDDGAHHENAHDLADGVLRKVEARKAYMRGVDSSRTPTIEEVMARERRAADKARPVGGFAAPGVPVTGPLVATPEGDRGPSPRRCTCGSDSPRPFNHALSCPQSLPHGVAGMSGETFCRKAPDA